VAWLPLNAAHTARAELQTMMGEFDFASLVPFGQEGVGVTRSGLLFRASSQSAPAFELLEKIEVILQLNSPAALRYRDKKNDQYRLALLEGEQVKGFLLAGDASSGGWMQTLVQEDLSASAFRRRLLLPSHQLPNGAPAGAPAKAAQVCSCLNVNADSITNCLIKTTGDDASRLAQLQGALKCGTQCGSCIPTLKRMVRENAVL
jgi:assimilatory nitrate reductase catalytic subunit